MSATVPATCADCETPLFVDPSARVGKIYCGACQEQFADTLEYHGRHPMCRCGGMVGTDRETGDVVCSRCREDQEE